MSLTTIVLIAGASWSILSISVSLPIGRAMKRADDTRRATYPPVVRPSLYKIPDWMRPPVPNTAPAFDPFWWLDDTATVNGILVEMENWKSL